MNMPVWPTGDGYYLGSDGTWIDRNVWCARCEQRTNNTNQGHYWALCSVLLRHGQPAPGRKRCKGISRYDTEFHFCCPGNCELYHEDGTRREVTDS